MKANAYFYRSLILSGLFTFAMLCSTTHLYAQFGDNLGKHKADRALDMNAKNLTNVALLKYKTLDVADVASGGDIGAAAATVDLYTAFQVTQATAGQDLTLPAPTTPTVGQMAYVKNTGTASFTMYVTSVAANAIVQLAWNGTAWVVVATGQSVNALAAPTGINANGGSITGNTLTLSLADGANPGLVSTAVQTIAGAKTFSAAPTVTPFSTAGVVHNNASGVLSSSTIVDADVNAAAAIAGSKISPVFTSDISTTGDATINGADLTLGVAATATSGKIVFNDANVATNTATIAGPANLTASYTLTLPADDGTADQVLKTDGAGALSWTNAASGWGLTGNAGTTAGTNFIGTTDDVDVTFKRSGDIAGTIGKYNTFFGLFGGYQGSYNVVYGGQAAKATTGSYNIAIGYQSLGANVAGANNVALGYQSLFYTNSASSSDNIGVGYQAGAFVSDGSTHNTGSIQSIYLGSATKASATTNTNEIVIGYNAVGLGSNSVVLGNSSITKTRLQGNVGIGTDAPTAKLDVVGDVKATRFISAAPATIAAAATTDIDLSTGNHFAVSVDTNITTLNLTNAASSPATIILKLIYSDTGTYTIEWPASFKWSGGAAPALTGVSGKTDVISLIYDGTSTYYCTYALNF